MIEILKEVAAPIALDGASVRLQGITFKDSQIWRPLYPTLFNYDVVPASLNLVPSFQVKTQAITHLAITLELETDQPFEFQSDQLVPFRVINGNQDSVTSSMTPKSCVLEIDLEKLGSKSAVVQVFCRGTEPMNPGDQGRAEVEGGLFLSIVSDPPQPDDPESRQLLHYNLFNDTVYTERSIVSAGLEPEPAFRVQQAQAFDVSISLGLPNRVFVPKESRSTQVALHMLEPNTEPAALTVDFLDRSPKDCGVQWASPSDSERRNYLVTSFSMEIRELTDEARTFLKERRHWDGKFGNELLEILASLLKEDLERLLPLRGAADPTIIDTPKCTTINGQTVCSDGAN